MLLSHTGISTNLAEELATTFTWTPPLAADSNEDYDLAGPESITEEELVEAFKRVDHTMSVTDPDLDSGRKEVLEGTVYSWLELELVEKGTKPASFEEDMLLTSISKMYIYCN